LNKFLEFFDKYFLDLLWVFVFSEEVEKEVDVESAFSFVGKRFEHCQNGVVGEFNIERGNFFD
jgi:hypothetical protein